MINVLEFFGEPLVYGGQESFMLNMYKNFESKDISYTICTPFNLTNKNLIDIAKQRKEEIIHYDFNNYSKFRRFYVRKAFIKILNERKFDVVHIQSSSLFTLYGCAKIAKKYKIKKVIVHAHIAANNSLKHSAYKFLTDKGFEKYADIFFACSDLAGKFEYSKKVLQSNKYRVIKNGIDTNKFLFDSGIRKEYRKKLNLKDEFTILNIGRFAKVKNHDFIVKIAEELNQKKFNFKVILIGDGELKNEIVNKIEYLNLNDRFIFLEKRNDIAEIMMASDLFILPSKFEGFPVTTIESQCSGLKTLCSNLITKEVSVTNLVKFLDISNEKIWAEDIINLDGQNLTDRKIYAKLIKDAGFDAIESAKILEKFYLGDN